MRSSPDRHPKPLPKGQTTEIRGARTAQRGALRRFKALAREPDNLFGRLTQLAADLFEVDVAFVAFLNGDREWLRESVGLDPGESRLATSLCTSTIAEDAVVVLENAGEVDRVRTGPLAQEAGLCFYAGVPIYTPAGEAIGAFSIMDSEPRSFSEEQRVQLNNLSQIVTEEPRHHREIPGQEPFVRTRVEREDQFEAVLEDPDTPMGLLSPDGTLLRANEALLQYVEEDHDEVVGRLFCEGPWWPDRMQAAVRESVEQAAAGESVEYSAEWVDRENQTYDVEGTIQPVKSRGGTTMSLVVSAREVTARTTQEAQLGQAGAQLGTLFEGSPDMISIHDLSGNLLRANSRLCNETGYEEEDLQEMKIWDIDRSMDPEAATDRWAEMEEGGRHQHEGTYRCADGTTVPVEVRVRRLRLEGTDVLMAVGRAVTGEERAEASPRVTGQRDQALIRNFPNGGVFLFDEDLRYTVAGGEGLEAVGLSSSSVEGERPHDLFPEPIAEELAEHYQDALEGERHTFEQKMGGRHYRNRTLPVRDAGGTVVAGMAVARDITEQKAQEQRLQQAGTLFQNAQDALFLIDVCEENGEKTLAYRQVNPAYEEKLNCSGEAIQGRSPREVYGAETGGGMEAKSWECARRREPIEYEETVPMDGETTYWNTRLAPVVVDGELCQIVGTTRDITAQRHRSASLERQNGLFARAQEIADVGAWEYDVESDITRWTPEVYRIHGRSPEALPTCDDVISYYHPADQPRLEEAIAVAIEEGESYDMELRIQTEDGELRWVRARGEPEWEAGEVVRLWGTIQDITDRKEQEHSLRQRQEKVEGLYEATNHLLQAENDEDLSTRLTNLVVKTLDFPATTIRLARDGALVPVHVPTAVQNHMPERPSYDIDGDTFAAEAYRSGETRAFDDLSARPDTSDRGDIRATAYVPMGAHGLISVGSFEVGGIGTFDLRLLEVLGGYAALVLDRLDHEEALREAKREAEEASRAKSSFLANMSHEIRTPLTSVIGFAEAVGTEVDKLDLGEDSPLPRYTDIIEHGGKRLLETLEGVLNLSKLEAGKMELEAEPIALADEAQRTAEELGSKARDKGVDLRLELDAAEARADAGGLQIVLRNLVTNAIKYTEEDGSVWIRTYRDEEQVVLEVEDTGIGMAPEQADDLLEPFRQASEGLSREYEGTGVGLAVTKKAAEQMGGSLDVNTTEGEGSQFIVQLPAVDGGAADR